MIVEEESVLHLEWIEDVFLAPFGKGFAGDAMDDLGHKGEPAITIEVFFSRFEIQFRLFAHDPHDLRQRDYIIHSPAGHGEQVPLVAETAGVMDEMIDRDRSSEVVHLGKVLADVVVDIQLTLISKRGDRVSGELFGNRSNVEYGGGSDLYMLFDVGISKSFTLDDLSISLHGNGYTGSIISGAERRRAPAAPLRLQDRSLFLHDTPLSTIEYSPDCDSKGSTSIW